MGGLFSGYRNRSAELREERARMARKRETKLAELIAETRRAKGWPALEGYPEGNKNA